VASTETRCPDLLTPKARWGDCTGLASVSRPLRSRGGAPLLGEQALRTVIGAQQRDSDLQEPGGPVASEPALMRAGGARPEPFGPCSIRRDRITTSAPAWPAPRWCWCGPAGACGALWSYGVSDWGDWAAGGPENDSCCWWWPAPPKRKWPWGQPGRWTGVKASPSAHACGRVAARQSAPGVDRPWRPDGRLTVNLRGWSPPDPLAIDWAPGPRARSAAWCSTGPCGRPATRPWLKPLCWPLRPGPLPQGPWVSWV